MMIESGAVVDRGVAVVTGGASGLGAAFAAELLNSGFRVAIIDKNPRTTEESAVPLGRQLRLAGDVTRPADVERAFDEIVERWGRVDVLVNNAGVFGPQGELDEVDPERLRAAIEVNLLGTMYCSRAAWRVMRAQVPGGGRIINNGSVSAQVPRPLALAYTASKHAITGVTKSLALDGRRHNIACGQIDIGNARTDMTGMVVSGALQADGSTRPEPTFDVAHVARAVVYMATLPLDTNVLSMTVMATAMPLVGRG